jgi:hypothetical protein
VGSIIAGFKAAASQIEVWAKADPGWLPVDPGATRTRAAAYRYRSASIPFADFPFGTAWRLGSGGTSSNRRDAQTSIQMFSSDGEYNNAGVEVAYSIGPGSKPGYHDDPGDVAVEPPRAHPTDCDAGPGEFASLLTGSATGLDWPDFTSLGLIAHPSYGFGPSYRGRLAEPAILVLADQASQDDLFTARALTGEAGQRLQGWLRAAGVTKRYGILRTLPVDSLGSPTAAVERAADHSAVQSILAAVIAKAAPKVVVAVGTQASRIVDAVTSPATPRLKMQTWADTSTVLTNWRKALNGLQPLTYPKDVPATFEWDGARSQIPRYDLPYGTLRWQGSSGDRADRATIRGAASADYYKFALPKWTAQSQPAALTAAEQAAVDALRS